MYEHLRNAQIQPHSLVRAHNLVGDFASVDSFYSSVGDMGLSVFSETFLPDAPQLCYSVYIAIANTFNQTKWQSSIESFDE